MIIIMIIIIFFYNSAEYIDRCCFFFAAPHSSPSQVTGQRESFKKIYLTDIMIHTATTLNKYINTFSTYKKKIDLFFI